MFGQLGLPRVVVLFDAEDFGFAEVDALGDLAAGSAVGEEGDDEVAFGVVDGPVGYDEICARTRAGAGYEGLVVAPASRGGCGRLARWRFRGL